ncbi:MAG: MlaD family protein [Alphaproteobacteria bacterium]|jgi:paraquat-inducible protein B
MSQKASTARIGLFVLTAIALFIGTFLYLNRGVFFSDSIKHVLYFEGSVKGLNVGSPVVFNGVPVGRVVGISLITDIKDMDIQIPVYIEGNKDSFTILNADGSRSNDQAYLMQKLIDKGLRAKLVSQNLLTGQMMIDLSFYPGTPIVLHGNGKIPEIPTLPSTIEELSKTIQNLPIRQTIKELNTLMAEMNELFRTINKDAPGIVSDAKVITETLASTSKKADKVLDSFSEGSRTMIDLNKTLRDFGYAAQSIRNWADYLERHPEALLKGKRGYGQ